MPSPTPRHSFYHSFAAAAAATPISLPTTSTLNPDTTKPPCSAAFNKLLVAWVFSRCSSSSPRKSKIDDIFLRPEFKLNFLPCSSTNLLVAAVAHWRILSLFLSTVAGGNSQFNIEHHHAAQPENRPPSLNHPPPAPHKASCHRRIFFCRKRR